MQLPVGTTRTTNEDCELLALEQSQSLKPALLVLSILETDCLKGVSKAEPLTQLPHSDFKKLPWGKVLYIKTVELLKLSVTEVIKSRFLIVQLIRVCSMHLKGKSFLFPTLWYLEVRSGRNTHHQGWPWPQDMTIFDQICNFAEQTWYITSRLCT